ncbi:MAG: restriction endonuclease [Flavobacteriaceae bacterium]|nr:restriction endonuclease [Flavobacteriaceae bacterium]
MKNIIIIKESGDKAIFNRDKLRASLQKSGADESLIQIIINEIESILYDGITTREIYKKAFALLRKHSRPTASRYKLKKGILELGPSGFPFEKFVGELLKNQGYKVKVGSIVQGICVSHEVDIIAEKEHYHYMIECKYHSSFKIPCNVKIPLYIQSRFLDIEKQWKKNPNHIHKKHQGWLVNNTRFTSDALQYGECVGLNLISWDYPKGESLKDLISLSGLYPITCLNTITKAEKQQLLSKNIVLCKQLCSQTEVLNQMGISKTRNKNILEDAHALCKSNL